MIYTDEQKHWIWLTSVPGLSAGLVYKLLDELGDPASVWEDVTPAQALLTPSAYKQLERAHSRDYMDELFGQLDEKGILAIPQTDERYPDRLRTIPEAPLTLFVRGDVRALSAEKAIGIVGSRKVTVDGAKFTHDIARDLAQCGVCIVSGIAYGADRQAHEGCLEGGGITVAVEACGVDYIHPRDNIDVAQRILESGGALVSEYRPGTRPTSYYFPVRNRIISGLSDGVLITEGNARSGAMITMRYAAEHMRARFAMPGSVYSSASEGPNQLLVEGAHCTVGAAQILDHFGWAHQGEPEQMSLDILQTLDAPSRRLVEILKFEEKSFDELSNVMKLSPSALNSLLTILEMQGIIRQSPGRLYRATIK